jgi:hypothetical protein
MSKEIWKVISNYQDYMVSNLGRVKSKYSGMLKLSVKNGYNYVSLRNDDEYKTCRVHRLVAQEFLVNNDEKKTQVNHKNGNKFDNTVDNLEYITPSDNVKHAINTGLMKQDLRKVGQYKDGKLIKEFISIAEASRETGIDSGSITKVCQGNKANKSAGGFVWEFTGDEKFEVPDEDVEMTQIPDFPNYSATRDGKVYSSIRKRYLIPSYVDGYPRVTLTNKDNEKTVKKTKFVHYLIAMTFIPNPDPKTKTQVNHKNTDKTDNRVENLEWVSQSENIKHAYKIKKEKNLKSTEQSDTKSIVVIN